MTYNLSLTREQVGLIGKALAELPYKSVYFLMAEIQRQVDETDTQAAPQQSE